MVDSKTQAHQHDSLKDYEPNRLFQVGAVALALIAGVGTSASSIWNLFYEKMKRAYGTRDLSRERYMLRDIFRQTVFDTGEGHSDTIWNNFFKKVHAAETGQGLGSTVRSITHKAGHTTIGERLKDINVEPGKGFRTSMHVESTLGDLEKSLRKIDLTPGKGSVAGAVVSRESSRQVSKQIENWYTQNHKALLKKFDYEVHRERPSIRGFWQQALELSDGKRLTIGFSTVVSVGTVLGAYLLLNQNFRMKNSNAIQDQNLRDLGQRLDAMEARRAKAERSM